MAKENKEWINSRTCWRYSKYESMVGRMSPYKLLAKDVGYAAWLADVGALKTTYDNYKEGQNAK